MQVGIQYSFLGYLISTMTCHSSSFLLPNYLLRMPFYFILLTFWVDPMTQNIYNLHPNVSSIIHVRNRGTGDRSYLLASGWSIPHFKTHINYIALLLWVYISFEKCDIANLRMQVSIKWCFLGQLINYDGIPL